MLLSRGSVRRLILSRFHFLVILFALITLIGVCRYNWTLAQQSRAGQVFFASTPKVPVPKVLAASENVVMAMEQMDFKHFLVRGQGLDF